MLLQPQQVFVGNVVSGLTALTITGIKFTSQPSQGRRNIPNKAKACKEPHLTKKSSCGSSPPVEAQNHTHAVNQAKLSTASHMLALYQPGHCMVCCPCLQSRNIFWSAPLAGSSTLFHLESLKYSASSSRRKEQISTAHAFPSIKNPAILKASCRAPLGLSTLNLINSRTSLASLTSTPGST